MDNSAESIKLKDDTLIESQFVSEYSQFALRMNFYAITALLEKARTVSDRIERKSICLSGLQLLYSSYEDFAVLLHAFRNKINGKHLHLTIGVEDQPRKGSTFLPRIFKHFKSARQMLDNFGFNSITHEKLSAYSITEDQLEVRYRDVAESIKGMGSEQDAFNDYKNKLKHGKPVVESVAGRGDPDCVVFLKWTEKDGMPVLEFLWLPSSLGQLEVATVQVAKIYIVSLEFLWFFMIHYYPAHADKYLNETMAKCTEDTVARVRALGLKSRGLTETP
jgi:hypothetical protein